MSDEQPARDPNAMVEALLDRLPTPMMVTRWEVKSATGIEANDMLLAGWEPVSCTGVEAKQLDPLTGQERTVGVKAFWHMRRSLQVPLAGGLNFRGGKLVPNGN